MKSIGIFFMLCGIILFIMGYMKEELKCPKEHVIKKVDVDENKPVTAVFKSMFNDSSPWINNNYDSTFVTGATRSNYLF